MLIVDVLLLLLLFYVIVAVLCINIIIVIIVIIIIFTITVVIFFCYQNVCQLAVKYPWTTHLLMGTKRPAMKMTTTKCPLAIRPSTKSPSSKHFCSHMIGTFQAGGKTW